MKIARVGVLFDRQAAGRRWAYGMNAFEIYIGELLTYTGIHYSWINSPDHITDEFDIIVVALAGDGETSTSALWGFAERGGALVAFAGGDVLASRLGCLPTGAVGAGYAYVGDETKQQLRFLNALPWRADRSDFLFEQTGEIRKEQPHGDSAGPLLQKFRIGQGSLDRWTVDIPATIVALLQGSRPVVEDGIPAPDGSAPVNDGILKADDQCEMDWQWDRMKTETETSYFAYPYADLWRERIIAHLIGKAADKGLTLPFIGYWPDGIGQVAMFSHDSDNNKDEHALSTLELLHECGIRSTWCMLEPGYSPNIYDRVKEAGHELAFHYNALDAQGGKWGEEPFENQLAWLKSATKVQEVTSNKNHYTRYEGFGELFVWCEKFGIQSDQTRGSSKKGNVGFTFATCHPYFPIAWANDNNRTYDVVELGFLTPDLDLHQLWPDSSVIVPLLDAVRKVEGVAHFVFHQTHIHNHESVRNAFRKIAREARKRSFVFWTGKQINDWTRARRHLRITGILETGEITVQSKGKLDKAVVWIPCCDNDPSTADMEIRYGFPCIKKVISV